MMDPRRIPSIDVMEADRRQRDPEAQPPPLLVDVREPDEFQNIRAVGAVLLPLSVWMLRYQELPTDRPIHVICESGGRSLQATAFLLSNGWTDVVNIHGGTMAWARAGLAIRRGAPEPGEGDLPG